MSYRHQQAARHAQLSAYCAEGNAEARDRMIASIERESEERRRAYGVVAALAAVGFVGAGLLQLAAWIFGFDI